MKKITCLALFGRFPWPTIYIGGSCLALPFKTYFEELLPVANYRTGISFLFHLPVQSCHLIFETVGLEAVPLFVFIST